VDPCIDLLQKFTKQKHDKFIGLLVHHCHAVKFFDGKCLELRWKPVQFLKSGDMIALISCGASAPRQVMGLLEYQGCMKIPLQHLPCMAPMHKVDGETLAKFQQVATDKKLDHLWGWQLSLRHEFKSVLQLPRSASEVWAHFTVEDIRKAGHGWTAKNKVEIDKSSFQVCRSFSSQSQDTPQSTATPTENSMDLFTLRDSQDTTESAEQEAEAFSLWKKHEMAIMVDT
ncbi:unnamed protein product, partial [Durusdinium trenchii]